jgi:hypothetical protein
MEISGSATAVRGGTVRSGCAQANVHRKKEWKQLGSAPCVTCLPDFRYRITAAQGELIRIAAPGHFARVNTYASIFNLFTTLPSQFDFGSSPQSRAYLRPDPNFRAGFETTFTTCQGEDSFTHWRARALLAPLLTQGSPATAEWHRDVRAGSNPQNTHQE